MSSDAPRAFRFAQQQTMLFGQLQRQAFCRPAGLHEFRQLGLIYREAARLQFADQRCRCAIEKNAAAALNRIAGEIEGISVRHCDAWYLV